ncbi:hypothetical protein GW796_05605 [archaeon]|nr:hypothetical protein [archaeon]NCQ51360.1 hypothetical protein [archaeon]NCT58814.1 hypothetical protein [archaeon]
MKTFKQFITEANLYFNVFVEKTLKNNTIDISQANEFLTPEYQYSGVIYKVLFVNKEEVLKYYNPEEGIQDAKGLASVIVKKFNPNRYVFYSKSLTGLDNLIKYPNLFKISDDQIGVIYSKKTNIAIDLTKYEGKDPSIKKRLSQTQEVLDFEDIKINKIDAVYLLTNSGWVLKTL